MKERFDFLQFNPILRLHQRLRQNRGNTTNLFAQQWGSLSWLAIGR
jgi:hypothetical protein